MSTMDAREKYLTYSWRYRKEDLKYCPRCGGPFALEEIPPEGGHEQLVCDRCHFIFYIDPKVVVTTVTVDRNRVVLLRRAQDPGRGLWCLPGGHIERGEDPFEAAARETKEETNLDVEIIRLLRIHAVQADGMVELVFEARPVGASRHLAPNIESDDIRFFSLAEIPWEALAFPTTRDSLAAWCGAEALLDLRPMPS
jgi:ADP-ribose pyrophosphatase YjhB (NUDIX family)